MRLLRPPRAPAPVLFISLALHAVPETWRPIPPRRRGSAEPQAPSGVAPGGQLAGGRRGAAHER